LLKLIRFHSNLSDKTVSLEEYLASMSKDQQKIYYLFVPKRETASSSPFIEIFNNVGMTSG
jgi:molecular chaperone HtpG